MHEIRRIAPLMRRKGINIPEVSPAEVQALFQIGDRSDVLAGFCILEDGRANPVDLTMSLAKGARMGGAQIFEGVTVAEIMAKNGTATGVRTEIIAKNSTATGVGTADGQAITAENVVICGGM